jgi:hypothetical protein
MELSSDIDTHPVTLNTYQVFFAQEIQYLVNNIDSAKLDNLNGSHKHHAS